MTLAFVLALGVGIFFYVYFGLEAVAVNLPKSEAKIDISKIDPLAKIGKSSFSSKSGLSGSLEPEKGQAEERAKDAKKEEYEQKKEKVEKSKEEKPKTVVQEEIITEEKKEVESNKDTKDRNIVTVKAVSLEISPTVAATSLDPMAMIGASITGAAGKKEKACSETPAIASSISPEEKQRGESLRAMVVGYPIEEMVPFIAKRDKATGSYLVAIAKKESDWGKHTPKKEGKECYNFWGFKGGYNPTESGYSCFDSPEQAIQMVGDRIGELVEKKVDTPERMVVWKCGSSCAGHDPGSVQKWISDVGSYYYKLNS